MTGSKTTMSLAKTMAFRLLTGGMAAALAAAGGDPAQARPGMSINPPTVPQTAPMTAGERRNLDMVLAWWREVIEGRHTDLAETYQAADYIQHDPNIPTGRAAFVKAIGVVPPAGAVPARIAHPPVVRGARGDFVWLVFENETPDPRDPNKTYYYYSFDVLRIRDGKIAEHWDSNRKAPGSPAFVRSTAPAPSIWNAGTLSARERRNVGVAKRELKDMLQYGHLELADRTIAAGYIQHNPNVPQGREGFKAFMARPTGSPVEPIRPAWKAAPVLTLANGPYVLMMWNWNDKDPADPAKSYVRNHFDLLRIQGGQVQEHWDEATIKPPVAARASDTGAR